nr:hypothetical protein [uncultured Dialister sp.]
MEMEMGMQGLHLAARGAKGSKGSEGSKGSKGSKGGGGGLRRKIKGARLTAQVV